MYWMTPFLVFPVLVGLGLAETTPGPLILVLQFVGFLAGHGAAGILGRTWRHGQGFCKPMPMAATTSSTRPAVSLPP